MTMLIAMGLSCLLAAFLYCWMQAYTSI